MKRVKISICIPTFNRADLLPVTLQCVADQTVKPDEVLIIDNASTDDTEKVVAQFKKYDFKYIRNKKNIGVAGNYNRCVKLASNEFFTFLPSDDLIAPTWYEEWIRVIEKHDADLYTSPLTIMNNHYQPIWAFPIFSRSQLIGKQDVTKKFSDRFTPGVPPSAASIFRRSVFLRIKPFKESEGAESDVRPAMELFRICNVYYFNRFLFVFREHALRSFDKRKEARSDKKIQIINRYFSIVKDVYDDKYLEGDEFRHVIQSHLFMTICNVNLYLARGDLRTITETYKSALRNFPNLFRQLSDWQVFIRYQIEFIRRGIMMYRIPPKIQKELMWLEQLKNV